MSNQFSAFWARDAFAYVDTYRRMLSLSSNQIEREKTKLEEQLWERSTREADTRMLAQLRAHEHALKQTVAHEEPGLVILEEGDSEKLEERIRNADAVRQQEIQELSIRLEQAKGETKKYQKALETMQGELIQQGQRTQLLQRKLDEQRASMVVVVVTSVLVGGVLLAMLLFG